MGGTNIGPDRGARDEPDEPKTGPVGQSYLGATLYDFDGSVLGVLTEKPSVWPGGGKALVIKRPDGSFMNFSAGTYGITGGSVAVDLNAKGELISSRDLPLGDGAGGGSTRQSEAELMRLAEQE